MRVKYRGESGVVLIVALIMLAMVTFLVVAFVGFARFERSSVSAALRRTEVKYVTSDSLAMAQKQAVEGVVNQAFGGLKVSRRLGGVGWAPVYIDTDGDINATQDYNSTYLNLNSEYNPAGQGGGLFQDSNGTGLLGDPQWIGILQKPDQPHGPKNRYIGRTAYMTVPVSP